MYFISIVIYMLNLCPYGRHEILFFKTLVCCLSIEDAICVMFIFSLVLIVRIFVVIWNYIFLNFLRSLMNLTASFHIFCCHSMTMLHKIILLFPIGGGAFNCFSHVGFLPYEASFFITFLISCGRDDISGPPHVLKLWLR